LDAHSVAEEFDMKNLLTRFAREESGATAIEYGLIAALIAVVIIGAITAIGSNMSAKFNTVASNLQ
jgi:pilus assembly protein Flp/PilA